MKKYLVLVPAILIAFAACKKDKKTEDPITQPPAVDQYASQKQQTKETYAKLAFAVYDDSYLGALELRTAISAFVQAPSAAGLKVCKDKWLAVRESYGQSETFRFAEGPIDNEADGPEGFINAWPMDEAYVDYVVGDLTSGIINHTTDYPAIDEATLLKANEDGGEENISLGFHAIEFLLWGQDTSSTGPGNRPHTDYITGGGSTAANQSRRGQYLNTAMDILVAGLKQVRDAWDPTIANNYRKEFLALDNTVALRKMFNSLKTLSGFELSGERMYTAYENQDQEDEHSCFSDNTHRDIYQNAHGMENLYLGSYKRADGTVVSGYSLKELITLYDAAKNTDIVSGLSSSIVKIQAMYVPFDQAIILPGERPKVLAAVNELQALSEKFKTGAALLGIQLQ